jgi:hypothetical protein
VKDSPYELRRQGEEFFIYKDHASIVMVDIAKNPDFYYKNTTNGIIMSEVGVMQGGALAFYLGPICDFWRAKQNCKFCSTGLNVGVSEREEKTVTDVVDVAKEAFKEGVADFIHINTGYSSDESCGIERIIPYIKSLKQAVNCLIAIQTLPPIDNKWIARAYYAGVDSVSFNFEFWMEDVFSRVCPGKSLMIGKKRFFEAIKYSAKIFPKGCVAGEIIAGIEPVSATMEAVDFITSMGALPIVCVFRPLKGTSLECEIPPDPEKLAPVFGHLYRQCKVNKLRMNLVDKVSLVIMPIEGRFFVNEKFSFCGHVLNRFFSARLGKRIFCDLGKIRRNIYKFFNFR